MATEISTDANLIAVIGDEDTVTGFLLAGVGQVEPNRQTNYYIFSDSICEFPFYFV